MKRVKSSQALDSILAVYERNLLEADDKALAAEADLQTSKDTVSPLLQAAFDRVGRNPEARSATARRRSPLRSTPLKSNVRQPRSERVERLRATMNPDDPDSDSQE